MDATSNINELKKKGAVIPAKSDTKPAIKGPGTRAILDIDWVTPNILPCSFAGFFLEMKLGTAVPTIPPPITIIVVSARKTVMLGTKAIKNKLIVINNDPETNIFSSPSLFASSPTTKPWNKI